MEWKDVSHTFYMHTISIYLSVPESVVSPGIALAISAMAFPSSCIRDTTADGDVGTDVGADVGINVGADIKEEVDRYIMARKSQNGSHDRISAFMRWYQNTMSN